MNMSAIILMFLLMNIQYIKCTSIDDNNIVANEEKRVSLVYWLRNKASSGRKSKVQSRKPYPKCRLINKKCVGKISKWRSGHRSANK